MARCLISQKAWFLYYIILLLQECGWLWSAAVTKGSAYFHVRWRYQRFHTRCRSRWRSDTPQLSAAWSHSSPFRIGQAKCAHPPLIQFQYILIPLIWGKDYDYIISVVIVGSYPIRAKRTDSNNILLVYLVIVIKKVVVPPRILRHIYQIRPVPTGIAPICCNQSSTGWIKIPDLITRDVTSQSLVGPQPRVDC